MSKHLVSPRIEMGEGAGFVQGSGYRLHQPRELLHQKGLGGRWGVNSDLFRADARERGCKGVLLLI